MEPDPIEALRKAIYTAAILRTENVMLTAPDARALLALVVDLQKFSETPNSGFPISKNIDNLPPKNLQDTLAENEHRLGLHEYSPFGLLCTAG
jgi:hypothetical protein